MKYSVRLYIIMCIAFAAFTSCIKNDIPFPRIQANFLTIEADGQDKGAEIDSVNRNVTLYFGETTDIMNVTLAGYTLTPGAEVVDDALGDRIDLSSPLDVYLHLYQDWKWTITAVQEIERYLTVSGQVGSTYIDVPGRRIVVQVSKTTPIGQIVIETAKLGPVGSTMSPNLVPGMKVDFSRPLEVLVTAYGRHEYWTIYVERSNVSVETVSVDAWTNVAWVYGRGEAGRDNGIEYRLKGDTQWIRVDAGDMTVAGGSFNACIKHLSPMTTYEARAYSDDLAGNTLEFTTGSPTQVPNSNFDSWWLDGKVWNPWPEDGEQVWDTGNKGATTLGSSNSYPTDVTSSGQGWAAELETRFVGIGAIGKLAAGNIFVGKYVRTDGTNGVLSFGHPFTERPTRMKGYMKYKTAPISSTSAGFENLKGQPDTCVIWCALIDQDTPFEIRTNPKDRQLFDPAGSYVVAYGKMECGENVDNYIPFEFELNYTSTSRVPKYILITASASKYGDYFTGGNGAVLCIDDFVLEYDY